MMVYTHVLNRSPAAVQSPADVLRLDVASVRRLPRTPPLPHYAAGPRRIALPDREKR
jgi:hypothetical protein